MDRFSRRRFLVTAGVSTASATFLKSCAVNPPEATESNDTETVADVEISPEQMPETTQVKLGYIPIVEAAALVIAQEKGFFKKYGMSEVELSKQASWAAARDNVTIGSQGGGIDGGQWQMPMPHLISEGLITNGQKIPMYVLAQLNTHGNGIAIAGIHQGQNLGVDVTNAAEYIKNFEANEGRKFKAAHTFPQVNQDFWIRYWFAAGGVDPDSDIDLLAVPPAETVQGMRNVLDTKYNRGKIELFDGTQFDADDPISYLNNLKIKRDFSIAEIILDPH